MRDLHVLKPRWVTEGIYSILNDKTVALDRGELTLDRLAKILDPRRYPANRHFYLLELMRKFELCVRFPEDDRYLIPELLDKQEPESLGQIAFSDLAFEYHYSPLLPEGLVPRFIVRTSALSLDQPRWRTGVVLTFEGNRALVKADAVARVLHISVAGAQAGRRRLLAIIRNHLEAIHRSYGITPTEVVPIQGHDGLFVLYNDLRVHELNNEREIRKVYGEKILSLNVSELLDSIDLEGTLRRAPGDIHSPTLQVFISYSHKDEILRGELETHLALLQRTGIVTSWADRCITPGDDWRGQIDEAVNQADIILLLVSANFVSSDYCWDIEMKRALARADDGSARVIPIIVRPCLWKDAPFARFQPLPPGGKPVTSASSRAAQDEAWTKVAENVSALAKQLARPAKASSR